MFAVFDPRVAAAVDLKQVVGVVVVVVVVVVVASSASILSLSPWMVVNSLSGHSTRSARHPPFQLH